MSQKLSIYRIIKKSELEGIMKKHKVLVVKVEAEWCGPCQRMKPLFADSIYNLPTSVGIVIIDLDQSPELKRYFRVQSVPLLLNIVDGEVLDVTNSGRFEDVESFFKKTLNRISQ